MKDLNVFYCKPYYRFNTVVTQEGIQLLSSHYTALAEQSQT